MKPYPLYRLADVADVVAGDPAPQDPEAFAPNGSLFVRMQDVGSHHLNRALSASVDRLDSDWLAKNRLRLFPRDSILIPKSGASVNLNHRAKLATDAYVVSHLAIVIPDRAKVDPDYLFWWSVRYDPRAQVQVTGDEPAFPQARDVEGSRNLFAADAGTAAHRRHPEPGCAHRAPARPGGQNRRNRYNLSHDPVAGGWCVIGTVHESYLFCCTERDPNQDRMS